MARLYTVKSPPSLVLPFAARKGGDEAAALLKGGGEALPLPFGVAKGEVGRGLVLLWTFGATAKSTPP